MTPADRRLLLRDESEWCAICGKMTNHRSGDCHQLHWRQQRQRPPPARDDWHKITLEALKYAMNR